MSNYGSSSYGRGRGSTDDSGDALPRILALVIGAAYLLLGIIGFTITGLGNWFDNNTDQAVFGFEINGAHNIVHLAIGALGLLLAWRLGGARTFGWLLFVGYGAAFVYGLLAVDRPNLNFLSLNVADNWLHLGSALLGLVIALWPTRTPARTQSR